MSTRFAFGIGLVVALLVGAMGAGDGRSTATASDRRDTPLRVMAFNIFLGGTYNGGEENLRQIVEFVRAERPDVVFMVETYGSGATIEEGLNEGLPPDRRYRGIQITREPGQPADDDNLWLFTRYPVAEVYPRVTDAPVTSFHFGGARLTMPSGREVNVFTVWLDALERAWFPTDATALDRAYGFEPGHTEEQIAATDHSARYAKAVTILEQILPRLVPDEDAPVVIGGDLNTLSAYDWSKRFAGAYSHEGLTVDWPVTNAFADAGFTDTYRDVYPDAGRYPGRTWSPYWGFGYSPARIDYVWTRGRGLDVASSHTRTDRLPRHEGAAVDEEYPFYSDHGALVTDLVVEGGGGAPFGRPRLDRDRPVAPPERPKGRPVDAGGVSATSEQSGFEAGRVLDGDPDTFWASSFAPAQPLPEAITLDLEKPRTVTGLRYVGHLIGRYYEEPGYVAGIDRYRLSVSRDGEHFVQVGSGRLERDRRPQWIPVERGTSGAVRYVRLTADEGFTDHAGAAELTAYERR
ncbi:MAG: hypothetical protein GEV10_03700 [Streptosporangiales bacterium]|nr:hypothetical protein [Streptosporangiales bacterium]